MSMSRRLKILSIIVGSLAILFIALEILNATVRVKTNTGKIRELERRLNECGCLPQ